jgi:actin-like ATPase involved in cell morphogenesis
LSAFGIDFGTTNSLAATIAGERALALVDAATLRPHPSVIWYRGTQTVVGQEAKQHLDITEGGAPPGFVRSPKMRLRREGPIFVDGRPVEPIDAVAEVLLHLKRDAAIPRERAKGHVLDRAVMTIPVDFGGRERRALRQAARKAGIGVTQFVHEPVAALYAYLRGRPDFKSEVARLEGRSVLVFDWGGGTLDLTLCRIQGRAIMQIASSGDNEVGGDEFDNRLRNLIRARHAAAHGLDDITSLEQPGMAAKLLHQCEFAKIRLSDASVANTGIILRHYLKTEGPAQNLVVNLTRSELEWASADIVARGLAQIDRLLEQSRLTHQDVELCLATGGMVNMPAIQRGLTERFIGRVPRLANGDRIIAEGAAWIAHDGLRLTLSKPIEILVADSSGHGSYHPLVEVGRKLPVENEWIDLADTRLFCVDPREGVAMIEFAKPISTSRVGPSDPRRTLCVASVKVDSSASPLLERIKCLLRIDDNYIVEVTLRSTGRGDVTEAEFHDLDFALALPTGGGGGASEDRSDDDGKTTGPASLVACATSNITERTNVVLAEGPSSFEELWRCVPGDIVATWQSGYYDTRSALPSARQVDERNFYVPCARCGRMISQIMAEGPVEACRGRPCGTNLRRPASEGLQGGTTAGSQPRMTGP